MAKVAVPVHRDVGLRLPLGDVAYRARVLDVSDKLILLRPEAALLALPEAPHYLKLEFADPLAVWEVPTSLHSAQDPWWFVRRPDEGECSSFQRRRHMRVKVRLPLMAIPVDGQYHPKGAPFPVEVHDLSATGCALLCEQPLDEGSRLVIVLALPGAAEGIPVIAEVLRVGAAGVESHLRGLRFLNMRIDHMEQIQAYVDAKLAGLSPEELAQAKARMGPEG